MCTSARENMFMYCLYLIFLPFSSSSEEGGMEAQIDQKQTEKMLYLQNKAPKWDETHGGHVLNFQVLCCIVDCFFCVLQTVNASLNPIILLSFFCDDQGRVTESSVKNFQLCCSSLEDPDQVLCGPIGLLEALYFWLITHLFFCFMLFTGGAAVWSRGQAQVHDGPPLPSLPDAGRQAQWCAAVANSATITDETS